MKLALKKDSATRSLLLFIQDSASATGQGKTGLAYNTANLTAYYARPRANAVAITLASQTTTGEFVSGGFVEIDATNLPGFYRFDPPDAAFASGADSVAILLKGASGMAPLPLEIQLTSCDWNDGAGLGLARVDAAISSRLAPTVPARTLDVSAGGEAGIDWSNIGAPSSTNALSGTTLSVNQTIASVSGTVGGVSSAVTVGTNNDKTGYALTAGERNSLADALLDRADAIEIGATPRQALKYIAATTVGKLSGANTSTEVFVGLGVGATRVTATVDSAGNRVTVALS